MGGIRPFVGKIAGDWRSFRKNRGARSAGLSGYEGAKMLELGRPPCNERLLVQTHIAIAEHCRARSLYYCETNLVYVASKKASRQKQGPIRTC